jgi:hypothetical protein
MGNLFPGFKSGSAKLLRPEVRLVADIFQASGWAGRTLPDTAHLCRRGLLRPLLVAGFQWPEYTQ